MNFGDQVDTGGDHGSGVNQRGDRRRTGHRVDGRIRGNCAGTDRAAQQQHQRRPHQHVVCRQQKCAGASSTARKFSVPSSFVEDEQRARRGIRTDTGHHEGFSLPPLHSSSGSL